MALLSDRQWRAFRSHRLGFYSSWFVLFLGLVAIFAEWLAHSRPIVMRYQGAWYVPIYQTLTNRELGIETDFIQVDYRALNERDPHMIAIWPLIKFDPYESDSSIARYPSAPDRDHWFGTDNRGRDVAARLIYGLRNSLVFAVMVWLMSYTIGILIGAIQGYRGGRFDFICQRVIEVLNAIPYLFLLIIVASIVQPNVFWLALLTTFFAWITISHYVRAEFLKLRELEFIEAAHALGLSQFRLFFKHLIPNAMTPVLTLSPFAITGNIAVLSSLDFLGFGIPAPAASWGELLGQAKDHFDHAWWLAVYPAGALASTLMAINFVGSGLREALDPRSGS